ncbi:hypothetical protein KBC04_00430 [Candidatus Babeliales bacterium]|nr:hypothetical protein [Candidatus Babeliales bacterium]MBP9843442.1 hypothetical protein [Candidatus Babeliales bacterium]
MKKRNLAVLFLLFFGYTNIFLSAKIETKQIQSTPIQSLEDAKNKTAEILFSQIMPTNSINEQIIHTIYGPTGLNVAQSFMDKIKKAYCYLEFLVKLDKVKTDAKLISYKKSFESFITQQKENKPLIPTQELVESDDWKSIAVTAQDLTDSPAWQIFLKGMVCDSFGNISETMTDIIATQNQIGTYLQNIETAYPTDEYTKLRLYLESIEIQSLLESKQRQYYLEQTHDWQKLSSSKLQEALEEFKKSEFYNYTHDSAQTASIKNSKKNNKKPIVPSPTQEQIICYFMLNYIQTTLFHALSTENVQQIILSASSGNLSPNFFCYKITDFIYLYDFLTLKDACQANRTSPQVTTLSITQPYDEPTTDLSDKTNQSNKKNQATEKGSTSQIQASQADDELIKKIFTKEFPTKSIHEKNIDEIYGATGLNIAQDLLENIKKTYCYLEFLVKLHKVKNNAQYKQYKTYFKDFMTLPADQSPIIPTQNLVESNGWDSVPVTEKEIQDSSAWQAFLKLIICDSFDSTTEFIIDIAQVNEQMSVYIANIEKGYNNSVFTDMRLYSESIQLEELLRSHQKLLYLEQCDDWKNLDDKKLQAAIETFKKTELYVSIHPDDEPSKNVNKGAEKKSVSLQAKEQVLTYFMLASLQKNVCDLITLDNVQKFLPEASSNKISPNFFAYQSSDFVYLYDYLTLSKLTEQNKVSTQTTDADNNDDTNDESHNTVVIQKSKNPFAKTNKATNKFFEKSNKATSKAFAKSNKGLVKTIVDINTGIGKMGMGLATGFIEMSAGLAYGFTAIGSKSLAEKNQQIVRKKMNAHKKELAKAFASITVIVIGSLLFPLSPVLFGAAFTSQFVGSMIVDKRVSEPIMKSLTIVFMPIMVGMAIITNGMTTGFIEMSAGCTLAGCSIAVAFGAQKINPKLEAEKVRAKLEKYRATLNIVMSVVFVIVVSVIVVAITILTGGTTAAPMVLVEEAVFNPLIVSTASGQAALTASTISTELVFTGIGSVGVATAGGGVLAPLAAPTIIEVELASTASSTTSATTVAATEVAVPSQFQFFTSQLIAGTVKNLGFMIGQALNLGFGVFSALGALNQDLMAALQAAQEKKAIQTLWRFVENNKIATMQDQSLFGEELYKKHHVATQNQALGLQYYKNFLHSSANLVQQQIAQLLSQQYLQLLTPDDNGLRASDIGSTWGLQTNFVYLYPSQGFISTTLGRPDFPYAQEVAQAPAQAQENNAVEPTGLSDKQKPQATKLWFNQRAIAVIDQPADQALNIEIKFRILYTLATAYHVGLYLGGNYHNYNSPEYLQSLQDTGTIDLNDDKLAKMLVIKRDDPTKFPSLCLYENEGKGWLLNQPLQETINTASIYHMSANLHKNKLTISFWSEDNPSMKVTKTMTVTPCNQQTFGVIFSGIALEWGLVQPNLPIIENQQARSNFNGQKEIDREKSSKTQWEKMLNPQFGSMKLQSLGRPAILQGNYLYTTQSTNLIDLQGNPITDYLVFATNTATSFADTPAINNLGLNPSEQKTDETLKTINAIVSLISGNVYNSSEQIIATQQNALQFYLQKNTTLSQNTIQSIDQSSKLYLQKKTESSDTTPVNTPATQTLSLSDLLNEKPPVTGGFEVGLSAVAPTSIVATKENISTLQKQAAHGATVQTPTSSSLTAKTKNSSTKATKKITEQQQNVPTQKITQPVSAPITQETQPQTQVTPSRDAFATQDLGDELTLAGNSGLSF